EVLLLYRPGTADVADPQMAEALELAGRDPELGHWFEEHRAFQKAMRANFRNIEVPAHLKASLLIRGTAQPRIVPPQPWWRSSVWLTVSVVVVLLLALTATWLRPRTPDRFANYQARMVSQVLREYRMDLVTNDMQQIRQFMAQRGAPADYDVSRGLERLQLTGGGLLSWRSHPVSMVCFDRGNKQMLFLFVTKRSALKDPPPATPQLTTIHQMVTASWTHGENTYILAGPEEADFAKKYL
ncbi:MAG: hypothetical protein NT154_37975, partial [Verrucomicrobia bacterium]|nr:hypothetical protein [Verrucomicrobiota bacterium]